MRRLPVLLAVMASLAAAPVLAEPATDSARAPVLVSAACGDLTEAARARHPECRPAPRTAARAAPAVPQKALRLAASRPDDGARRIVTVPWLIGYN